MVVSYNCFVCCTTQHTHSYGGGGGIGERGKAIVLSLLFHLGLLYEKVILSFESQKGIITIQ